MSVNGRFDMLAKIYDPSMVIQEYFLRPYRRWLLAGVQGRVLEGVRRVLSPGGRLLLLEHVRPRGPLGRIFDAVNLVWSPLVCHLERETESLVGEAGFTVARREAPVDFLRVVEAVIV